ncbi:MAG: hypothetical protein ACE5R4_08865 [Armatimonadota bacterium]
MRTMARTHLVAALLAATSVATAGPGKLIQRDFELDIVLRAKWGDGPGEVGERTEQQWWWPEEYTVGPDGSIYIADLARNKRILIFDPEGRYVDHVPLNDRPPMGRLSWAGGSLYMVEMQAWVIWRLDLESKELERVGELPVPGNISHFVAVSERDWRLDERRVVFYVTQHVQPHFELGVGHLDGTWVRKYGPNLEYLGTMVGRDLAVPAGGREPYTLGDVRGAGDETLVDLRHWSLEEMVFRTTELRVPLPKEAGPIVRLLGVDDWRNAYLLVRHSRGNVGNGWVLRYDRKGALLAQVVVSLDYWHEFLGPPLGMGEFEDALAVSPAGDLYCADGDDEGFYIGRIRARRLRPWP